MSDSQEPTWPGAPEVEALVSRIVAERIDPLRAQLTTVSRAIAILAERMPPPQEVGQLSRRIEFLAARIQEAAPSEELLADLERAVSDNRAEVAKLASVEQTLQDGLAELGAKVSGAAMTELAARSDLAKRLDGVAARFESSIAPLLALPDQLGDVPDAVACAVEAARRSDTEAREAQAEDLRRAVASAVEDVVAQVDRARGADTIRLLGRIASLEAPLQKDAEERRSQAEELRQSVAVAVEAAVARIEGSRNADTDRLLERIAALEAPLQSEGEARRAQTDELRQALAVAVAHAVAKIDQARGAEATTLHEQVAALAEALVGETEARTAQAAELRSAVTEAIEQADVRSEAGRAADLARLSDQVAALEAPLIKVAESRRTEADELRTAIGASLDQAIGRIEAARTAEAAAFERSLEQIEAARAADAGRLLEQVATLAEALTHDAGGRESEAEQLRAAVAGTIDRAVAEIEATRAADATRVLEQVAALEGPLTRDAIARQDQLDDLRHTVATTIDQAVSRIESARSADAVRFLEQVAGLGERAEADAQRRDAQAAALLAAVDERLQALHLAGSEADAGREDRLTARLEAVVAEQASGLLARIDQRTAAITDLESIPPLVASEVRNATAAALTSQVQPLVARLVEAIDTLAHEGGRIEAMARAHAGEARAVEDRVATLFVEVAERAELAVDHSRARIAEGQVALSTRFDAIIAELLTSVTAVADRLDARLAETAEGLRAASGHQAGALLDAVNRGSQQVGEGLAEVRSALYATGTEWASRGAEADRRAESLTERLEALRATVESIRHDPRLEALVVEQVAAREAQLTAIEAVSKRIDEVGPVVARALLSEVERATRAANAAEEAVVSLRPEALRSALGDAAEEIRSAASRLDDTIGTLADQVGHGLAALSDSQSGIREKLVELQQPSDEGTVARLEALDRSLAGALTDLAAAIASSREELLALTTKAIERSSALADEVASASGTALEDLRASQTVLRETVQDGAHKAELAAIDIRGLRERLTPHLVALADATTRRAEADQAGFDAVLARLDQLLAARQR